MWYNKKVSCEIFSLNHILRITGGIIMRANYNDGYYSNGIRYKEVEQMSARAYNLTIGGVLLWGFIINALMCATTSEFFMGLYEAHPILFLVAYFAVAIPGIIICHLQKGTGVTFFGYNLIVFAVGTLLAICVPQFDAVSILSACAITVIVTLIMIVVSTIKPDVFLSMGWTLFICLSGAIIIECIMLLLGIHRPTLWDFAIVILFCGYVGYDWALAQTKQRTVENAVNSCAGLYLDIINIFIRMLGKGGSSSSKSSK